MGWLLIYVKLPDKIVFDNNGPTGYYINFSYLKTATLFTKAN